MRTLFLSSSGLRDTTTREEFLKILPKPIEEIKMAYVTTAVKEASVVGYEQRDRVAIDAMKVNYVEMDIADKTSDELREIFADIFWYERWVVYYLSYG